MSDGYVGIFSCKDIPAINTKLEPYLSALRNSIYQYLSVELFENLDYCASGESHVDLIEQKLRFVGAGVYQSKNMIPSTSTVDTTYNYDCVFFADCRDINPLFEISCSGLSGTWKTIKIGEQYCWDKVTISGSYYIRITPQTYTEEVYSFGLLFGRKSKFRDIIKDESVN